MKFLIVQLGIPTVSDRIAQEVVRSVLEPELEKVFDEDSSIPPSPHPS
jgi:retron-type reverse transcriptase